MCSPPRARQVATFVAFAQRKSHFDISALQFAAAALNDPKSIELIWQTDEQKASRKLNIPKSWQNAVANLGQLVAKGELQALTVVQAEPLHIRPVDASVQAALVARVLCKGTCTLPPDALAPWRWPERWAVVLTASKEMGPDFCKGLNKAAVATGKNNVLNLRSLIGGHRPTALRAIGAMLGMVSALDLRDNMLTAAELTTLGRALASARSLNTLVLSGNPLDATAVADLCGGLAEGGANNTISDLELSRTTMGGAEEAAGALASVVSLKGELRSLVMSHTMMDDAAGAAFITNLAHPSPPLGEGVAIKLATLDLSHNALHSGFASKLKTALSALNRLTTCSLAHNNLGADVAGKVIRALLGHPSLRTLDLTNTNLCDCSPQVHRAVHALLVATLLMTAARHAAHVSNSRLVAFPNIVLLSMCVVIPSPPPSPLSTRPRPRQGGHRMRSASSPMPLPTRPLLNLTLLT